MLYNLVAYEGTSPCGFAIGSHVDVPLMDVGADADGTPSPDEAVGAVRGGLASIEGTAVEHALLAIARPVGTGVAEACFQRIPAAGHHVLHLAAPWGTVGLAIDKIPVVAHLEDVGALAHAVPDHGERCYVLPVFEVAALEFCELELGSYDHTPLPVIGLEYLRVAEVISIIAVVSSLDAPEGILGPCLEIRGCGTQHHLAVGASAVVPGVVDVVELVCLVIDGASGAEGSILHTRRRACGQHFTQGLVAGSVLGADAPEGMEGHGGIVVILLKVEHLEFPCLLVIEGHGVSAPSDGGVVVGVEACVVC